MNYLSTPPPSLTHTHTHTRIQQKFSDEDSDSGVSSNATKTKHNLHTWVSRNIRRLPQTHPVSFLLRSFRTNVVEH